MALYINCSRITTEASEYPIRAFSVIITTLAFLKEKQTLFYQHMKIFLDYQHCNVQD